MSSHSFDSVTKSIENVNLNSQLSDCNVFVDSYAGEGLLHAGNSSVVITHCVF